MEIRKLRPEENVHRILMSSICFGDAPPEDRYSFLEEPEKHTSGYEHSWGVFDDEGRLLSCLQVIPARMQINGHPVKFGLVCGVTTLPEVRNSRCVRKMYESIMPHMKDEGMVFSFLYPFSFPFYRKFGYEHAWIKYRASVPISELAKYPYPDGIKIHDKGGPWVDFAKVYETFIQGKNLAMVRGKEEWENLLRRDPYKNREFTYIHYNSANEPDAYILYNREKKDKESTFHLKIVELAWADKIGLHSILGFIYGMRSEYEDFSWMLPNDADIYTLVENPCNVSLSIETIGMNRVLDVPAALRLIVPPPEAGNAVIGITDAFLCYNTGVYCIAWEDGRISIKNTGRSPDMEINIETLAQLITGYQTPAQAQHCQNVVIHSKMEELMALFPLKNLYLMERF